jgi:L-iditol 2-dehydrogenase
MKSAVLYGQMDIRYEDLDMPEINDEEVLVKVKVTGICGSDLPRVLGKGAHYYPIVLGHEFSGEIVKIGVKVNTLFIGERVACAPLVPCHRCPDCQKGNYSQCKNYTFIGSRDPGSWAEYVKVPAINCVQLPAGVTFEQGAFFEPTTVALHGLNVMKFHGGTDVAVIGMGTIGLLTLQWAKILGARRAFAFDIDEGKLRLARELGADFCLNTGDDDFRDIIQKETDGRGFDMVAETAGVQFTEILSLEIAANQGNVMFIGTPSQEITLTPREFEHMNRKELTVRGSWMSYSAPFPGIEWELAGYYFQSGRIKCDTLIDKSLPLEHITDVFKDLNEAGGKMKGKVLLQCT